MLSTSEPTAAAASHTAAASCATAAASCRSAATPASRTKDTLAFAAAACTPAAGATPASRAIHAPVLALATCTPAPPTERAALAERTTNRAAAATALATALAAAAVLTAATCRTTAAFAAAATPVATSNFTSALAAPFAAALAAALATTGDFGQRPQRRRRRRRQLGRRNHDPRRGGPRGLARCVCRCRAGMGWTSRPELNSSPRKPYSQEAQAITQAVILARYPLSATRQVGALCGFVAVFFLLPALHHLYHACQVVAWLRVYSATHTMQHTVHHIKLCIARTTLYNRPCIAICPYQPPVPVAANARIRGAEPPPPCTDSPEGRHTRVAPEGDLERHRFLR